MTFFHKNLVPQNPISFSTIDNSSLEICFWVSYRCTKSIGNNFDLKVIKWVKNDFFFLHVFQKVWFQNRQHFCSSKMIYQNMIFGVILMCVQVSEFIITRVGGQQSMTFFCGFFLAKKVWFQNLSYNLSSSCTSYLGLIYELSCRWEIRF